MPMKQINEEKIKDTILKKIDDSILVKSSMQGMADNVLNEYKKIIDNATLSTEVEKTLLCNYLNHNLTLLLDDKIILGSELYLFIKVGYELDMEVNIRIVKEKIAVVYTVHSEQLTQLKI